CSSFENRCVAEKDGVFVSTVRTETTPAKSDNGDDETDESVEPEVTECPDGSHCKQLNTCCPIRDSVTEEVISFECCPLSNAVCCDTSCCPRGYHCISGGRCEKKALANRFMDYFV
ncbi:CRE-PGRN-1 protein, partial [Aphelenchoides avenae]